MINISFTRESPAATLPRGVYRVPDVGTYWQGVQDIDSGEWFDGKDRPCPRSIARNYKMPPNDALPSTIQLWGAIPIGEFFPLDYGWQKFWLDLIDRATEYTLDTFPLDSWTPIDQIPETHLYYWWAYATQNSLAMTDGHAALNDGKVIPVSEGGYADYILGINLENPKPIAKKSLDMSGNIFKEIGRTSNYIVIETIDAGYIDLNNPKKLISIPPPTVDEVWDKPWLIHFGVESTTAKLEDGSYVQSRFPPKPYGLPFPVLGINGKNWIKPNRMRAIDNGVLFSPYHPTPTE